ncbi:Sulfide dehydrogenase [flavocytochrome c] flavoprotein chain precursor [Brevibacillus laterosporus]|nr:Sulfide dehydrogenase [flavocytochrome c] flavoprotein chain precursor [Brevibacillus laterosporus]
MAERGLEMSDIRTFSIVIVGGGSAGIMVAARLLRARPSLRGNIAIIDPSDKHYYQPLWTLVGAGVVSKEKTEREEASQIPKGAIWIKESIEFFFPEMNQVRTALGEDIQYEYLVVAAGIEIGWDKIKGLPEAIGKGGVCSNYSYEHVSYTWECLRTFAGGTAIFTHPNTPIKCGGAPQKIMYLADDHMRKAKVRSQSQIIFASANASIFAVKKYADALQNVINRKNIHTNFRWNLIEILSDKKEALFVHLDTKELHTLSYDMLHVVPPMFPPRFIRESPLADEAGWVEIDSATLQHRRYPSIFSLGDCSNLPTSKTGAAIRKQAPVLVANLLAVIDQQSLSARYDGYTSCPLVTGYNRVILAEFDYKKEPRETFPFDQSKERYSMYRVKKDLLPLLYWRAMMKGRM